MKNMKNSVHIIGNVGTNPVVKELKGGKLVTRFAVATHETMVKDGEKCRVTNWHQIVAWGKRAEKVAAQIEKGCAITVEGKLTQRQFEGSEGNTRRVTEILLTDWVVNKQSKVKTLKTSLAD